MPSRRAQHGPAPASAFADSQHGAGAVGSMAQLPDLSPAGGSGQHREATLSLVPARSTPSTAFTEPLGGNEETHAGAAPPVLAPRAK